MVKRLNEIVSKHSQLQKIRVCLAMSGGVDSSAAAVLLKEQGYEVVGVFMKFWKPVGIFANCQPWENNCCSEESETIARLVANKLGIAFYVVDFQREFKRAVVDYFLKELKSGRTPNPCIVCNQEIKFGLLFKKAMALGADYLATGHYTRNQKSKIPPSPPAGGFGGQASPVGGQASPVGGQAKIKSRGWGGEIIYKLLRAKDANKDQSYFLWTLKQKQLKHLLFPLGGYTKSQAREIVAKLKLPIAPKESFDICFVPNNDYEEFIKKYLSLKPGPIIDTNGQEVGEHRGLSLYTIGQRKGIGAGGGPFFVIDKDIKNNTLIVAKNQNDRRLWKKELIVDGVNWLGGKLDGKNILAKIRYRGPELPVQLEKISKNKYRVIFKEPQRAATPGQSVVFYRGLPSGSDGQELLGGGVIVSRID